MCVHIELRLPGMSVYFIFAYVTALHSYTMNADMYMPIGSYFSENSAVNNSTLDTTRFAILYYIMTSVQNLRFFFCVSIFPPVRALFPITILSILTDFLLTL